MNNAAIFEKAAARELSAEEAARLMLEADALERVNRRPTWAPIWLWALGGLVFAIVLSIFGIERHST